MSAWSRAVGLLARREYSRAELRQRLRSRGHDEDEIDTTLARLVELDLQSDARWTETLTRRRQAQGYGPLRIRAELRAGAADPPELLDQGALAASDVTACDDTGTDADTLERAVALLERRSAGEDFTDPRPRARALRLLIRRGFPASMAAAAVLRVAALFSARASVRNGQSAGGGSG